MLLCMSALAAESLMHLLGTHLNRSVQGVAASTAQAEDALISARCSPDASGALQPRDRRGFD